MEKNLVRLLPISIISLSMILLVSEEKKLFTNE